MAWTVALVCAAIIGAAAWKRSLVAAEWLKISNHPFLYVALAILILGVPLSTELSLLLGDYKIGGYRPLSAFLVFSIGASFGVRISVFVILIFSALSVASEFDRGTIKVILTRPVTRTEVFFAKCVSMMALSLGLVAVALLLGLMWGLFRGELGHIWKVDVHHAYPVYDDMLRYLWMSIGSSVLSIIATAFLGVLISTLIESSGHAVAAALILFILLDLTMNFLRKDGRMYFFTFYQTYGFGLLRDIASGSAATQWDDKAFRSEAYAVVPGVTSAVLAAFSYLMFRFKNITA